jgi:glycine/D-amino acid oxidase-like deaminating enzyme
MNVAPPVSSPLPKHAPLLVIGAGAAGLTAAYFAAQQGAQVGWVG